MAVVCLHFSDTFKEKLLSGEKRSSILHGAFQFTPGTRVFVYLSQGLVEASQTDTKIGTATIQYSKTLKVGEVTDEDIKKSGHQTIEAFKNSTKRWYNATAADTVTIISFEFIPLDKTVTP
ncbi:hypothetical protein HY408_00470 [Candidatus Gottesmanbacteria bacterium]|nr:hypothetical protein [Candidatus Gottesmanbacteria bacterium]